MNNPQTVEEKAETEEWGAWKFVSDMLYNPDVSGIYPTSKCYEQIHDFVVEQKHGDRLAHKTAMLEAIKGEKEKLATYGALNARRAGHNIKKILAIGKLQALDRAEDIINKIYE